MSDSEPRVSVRAILAQEGLTLARGEKGMSDDKIAKQLAGGAGMSATEFAGVMASGKALGEHLGLANKRQVTRHIAHPYATVLKAMIVTMRGGASCLSLATDTRDGACLEGGMPSDMLSSAGTVAFDVLDRGAQGTEVIGASEVKGQMFAWGKGERMLKDILDKAEQLARRYWLELDVQLLDVVRFLLGRGDPFLERRPLHDVVAVLCGWAFQSDIISDEARAYRRIHRIGDRGARTKKERAAVEIEALCPDGQHAADVAPGAGENLEAGIARLEVHRQRRTHIVEPGMHLAADRAAVGALRRTLRQHLGSGKCLV